MMAPRRQGRAGASGGGGAAAVREAFPPSPASPARRCPPPRAGSGPEIAAAEPEGGAETQPLERVGSARRGGRGLTASPARPAGVAARGLAATDRMEIRADAALRERCPGRGVRERPAARGSSSSAAPRNKRG